MSPRNNITKIIFKRRDMTKVTLVESFLSLLYSIRGIVKEELTKEVSIVPRIEYLQSIRSSSRRKIKLIEVM